MWGHGHPEKNLLLLTTHSYYIVRQYYWVTMFNKVKFILYVKSNIEGSVRASLPPCAGRSHQVRPRRWRILRQLSMESVDQCSRLKPSYEFRFEGLSNFSPSIERLVQIQDVNKRISNTKLMLNLCMNYMIHVSNTMWRIKKQPSNSTSRSDNALCLLVLVTGILRWRLQVMSSFSIWGCVSKGYFERGIFRRAISHLKGIEDDFNLEHWCGCK
jgi:hypothetical protein